MWCRPEGFEGFDSPSYQEALTELRAKFVTFYVTVLKRLKAEFGDTIRVGGPALQTYREDWFRPLLGACRAAGVAPDFISWHGYEHDPMTFNRQAEKAHRLCAEYGFPACELIVNEWHYFGENYTWTDMQRCSDPKVKARIFDGPDGHNAIRGAAFTLATLANLQRSKVGQAYFYGCNHTGSWGFKDAMQTKNKVFHALRMFGDILRRGYTTVCESTNEGSVTTLAVKAADGRRGLLVVDYGGGTRALELSVSGVGEVPKATCLLLDHTHDVEPHSVCCQNGKLRLTKPDFHSAAFFVEFD